MHQAGGGCRGTGGCGGQENKVGCVFVLEALVGSWEQHPG